MSIDTTPVLVEKAKKVHVGVRDGQSSRRNIYDTPFADSALVQESERIKDEVNRHKWYLSEKKGEDVGEDRATVDWIISNSLEDLKEEHLSTVESFDAEAVRRGEHLTLQEKAMIDNPNDYWAVDIVNSLEPWELLALDKSLGYCSTPEVFRHYGKLQRKWVQEAQSLLQESLGREPENVDLAEDYVGGDHHNSERFRLVYVLTNPQNAVFSMKGFRNNVGYIKDLLEEAEKVGERKDYWYSIFLNTKKELIKDEVETGQSRLEDRMYLEAVAPSSVVNRYYADSPFPKEG